MNTLPRPRLLFLLAVAAPVILTLQPANVDAQTKSARPPLGLTAEKEKMMPERSASPAACLSARAAAQYVRW